MTEILLGIAMFTAVILLVVALLLVAKRKLVAAGDVTILINDDPAKALRVPAGGTLLASLAEKHIYIPSACGGKGACGVCEVVVREGGGDLLPTETGFISRGEAKRGCRLACQVKVKRDMKIEVAPEIFEVRKWTCRVVSNRNVATFIKELKLALPEGEEVPFRAGGYVQIRCPAYDIRFRDFDIDERFRPTWDRFDLWRFRSVNPAPIERAYSMANFPLEKGLLLFTIRIAFPPGYREDVPPGVMSSWIFNLKPGDEVVVSGPFGEFFARLHRRRRRHGAHALAHLRPAQAAGKPPQDDVLVRRAQPAGGVLRRRVRRAAGGQPELPLDARAVRAAARGSMDRGHGLHPQRALRELPQGPPGARGHRVLHVRPGRDEQGRHRHAALARRRPREHPARRLRLMGTHFIMGCTTRWLCRVLARPSLYRYVLSRDSLRAFAPSGRSPVSEMRPRAI